MMFLCPEVAVYLNKSAMWPCKEYCCHVWAGTPSCYLDILDKLQKLIYRTVAPTPAPSLVPLDHQVNVTSWSLFYRYYFGRCLSELGKLVPCYCSCGRSTCYSDRYHNYATVSRCYKNVYVNNFFLPHTGKLWNYVPAECFSLIYDHVDTILNVIKWKVNFDVWFWCNLVKVFIWYFFQISWHFIILLCCKYFSCVETLFIIIIVFFPYISDCIVAMCLCFRSSGKSAPFPWKIKDGNTHFKTNSD